MNLRYAKIIFNKKWSVIDNGKVGRLCYYLDCFSIQERVIEAATLFHPYQ